MSKSIWSRLTAAPLSIRYYQVTNGVVNCLFGKRMGITHLVEYPRCGGTWIRHLMQDSMGIQQYAYDRMLTKNSIIQCHVLPSTMINRAVVLFRDPRDAIVSFYHKKVNYDKNSRGGQLLSIGGYQHDPERDPKEDFHEFLKVHLTTPDHPRFSFGQFADAWLAQENTCVVKYEDFKTEPAIQLRRLTDLSVLMYLIQKLMKRSRKTHLLTELNAAAGKCEPLAKQITANLNAKGLWAIGKTSSPMTLKNCLQNSKAIHWSSLNMSPIKTGRLPNIVDFVALQFNFNEPLGKHAVDLPTPIFVEPSAGILLREKLFVYCIIQELSE